MGEWDGSMLYFLSYFTNNTFQTSLYDLVVMGTCGLVMWHTKKENFKHLFFLLPFYLGHCGILLSLLSLPMVGNWFKKWYLSVDFGKALQQRPWFCKARPSVSSVMYMVVTRSPLSRVFLGRCEGEHVCMLVCFEKLVWRACVAPC